MSPVNASLYSSGHRQLIHYEPSNWTSDLRYSHLHPPPRVQMVAAARREDEGELMRGRRTNSKMTSTRRCPNWSHYYSPSDAKLLANSSTIECKWNNNNNNNNNGYPRRGVYPRGEQVLPVATGRYYDQVCPLPQPFNDTIHQQQLLVNENRQIHQLNSNVVLPPFATRGEWLV